MKLLKMVMFAALAPAVAVAGPQQPSQPDQSDQPSQMPTQDQSGGNIPDHDNSASTGTRAFGLTAKPLSGSKRATYGAPSGGLLVTNVESGGAAESAGIQVGDVITKIDNTPMATRDDLMKAWQDDQKGDKSTTDIELVRNHQTKSLQLNLASESAPDTQQQQQRPMPSGGY